MARQSDLSARPILPRRADRQRQIVTSLSFALDHAAAHGHRRVIYVIPFTSDVEQTAAVFREALGSDAVLEHHSAFDAEAQYRGDPHLIEDAPALQIYRRVRRSGQDSRVLG